MFFQPPSAIQNQTSENIRKLRMSWVLGGETRNNERVFQDRMVVWSNSGKNLLNTYFVSSFPIKNNDFLKVKDRLNMVKKEIILIGKEDSKGASGCFQWIQVQTRPRVLKEITNVIEKPLLVIFDESWSLRKMPGGRLFLKRKTLDLFMSS